MKAYGFPTNLRIIYLEADRSSKSGVPDSAARGAAGFMVENVHVLVKCNKRRLIFYQCMRKRCCQTCVVSRKWWHAAKLSFQPEKCSPERINRSLIGLTHLSTRAEHLLLPSRAFVCELTLPAVMMTEVLDPLTAKILEAMNIYSPRKLYLFIF